MAKLPFGMGTDVASKSNHSLNFVSGCLKVWIMKKQCIALFILGALAACSPQNSPTAASQPAPVSAVAASETGVQAASQMAWTPPPKATSPRAEAQQIHDLMKQFQHEAAERMRVQRQKNMKPSQAESLTLMREEVAAIRYDAQRLQQLEVSSKAAIDAQTALVNNMLVFANSADLQIKSIELLAQGKQTEAEVVNKQLGEAIQQIQIDQKIADDAYHSLLNKHQIQR